MNTKIISIVIGLILIAGIGGVVYFQKYGEVELIETDQMEQNETSVDVESTNPSVTETPTAPTAPTAPTPTTGGTSVSGITASTITTHNSRTSCWSSINGNVYDLTSWIPNHPGGEKAILQLCGIDGSTKFNGKHGDAPKQATILAGFKIGVLAQ